MSLDVVIEIRFSFNRCIKVYILYIIKQTNKTHVSEFIKFNFRLLPDLLLHGEKCFGYVNHLNGLYNTFARSNFQYYSVFINTKIVPFTL